MRYTIHEMSRLLGVPAHTLRYYDKIGIIQPQTDQSNGYRYYSVVDSRRFHLCRAMRAAGFSLEDCRLLLTDPQAPASADLLERQAEELNRKAVLAQLTAEQLQKTRDILQNLEQLVGQIGETRLPDAWRLTLAEGETPIKDPFVEQQKQQWMEYLPVAHWVSRVSHETLGQFGQGRMHYAPGLMLMAEDAQALGIPKTPQVEFVPGGEYVYTIWRQVGRGPFGWDSLQGLLGWIRQKKIPRFGEGLGAIVASRVNQAGEVENYYFLAIQIFP